MEYEEPSQEARPAIGVRTRGFLQGVAAIMLVLAVFLWATNTVVGRLVNESIPAFSLSFWRWGFAALLLAPVALPVAWRQRGLYVQHWRMVVALSVLNVTAYNTCQYWALEWIEASAVGIVAASIPVVMFVAAWVLRLERANGVKFIGLLVALVGVALILTKGRLALGTDVSLTPGEPIILVGVICFGIYSVLVKQLSPAINRFGFLGIMITVGWIAITPAYITDVLRGELFSWTLENVAVLVYVALFPSIVANWFWLKGLQTGGALMGALTYNLLPVFVCIMAVPVLGEDFTWSHALGITLVLTGANLHYLMRMRIGYMGW